MKFSAVVVLAPDDLEQEAIHKAKESGASSITIMSGRGLPGEEKKTFLGLTFEGSQSVLIMIVAKHLSVPILKAMRKVLITDGESRGLAFSIALDHLTGIETDEVQRFEQRLREQQDL